MFDLPVATKTECSVSPAICDLAGQKHMIAINKTQGRNLTGPFGAPAVSLSGLRRRSSTSRLMSLAKG